MALSIDSVTIGGTEDRRFTLDSTDAARAISIGSNWSRIRVGCRLSFQDSGGNIAGTPRLYVGMLSNPTANLSNGPLGGSTSHFVGLIANTVNWVRTGGTPTYYTVNTGGWFGKKIGGAITTVAGVGVSAVFVAMPTLRRTALFVDIIKGSPNFTIRFALNQGLPVDWISEDHVKVAMRLSDSTVINTYATSVGYTGYNTGSVGSLAVDEGVNGALNAVCVGWDRVNPVCYVSEVFWARITE